MDFFSKYKKYKQKYINLKNQIAGNYNKKALILCHPRNVTGTFEPLELKGHWFGNPLCSVEPLFKIIFKDYNLKGVPKFETVDILSGGTYQEDAFGDEFINKHINDYDLVMVPDCAGVWNKLQEKSLWENLKKIIDFTQEEKDYNITTLINICLNLTRMVKPGGIIYFGKFFVNEPVFIQSVYYDSFCSALNYYLNENGFSSKISELSGIGKYIVAVKNY